ncbi:MAG TPA: hypothetical protein PKC69_00640 [Chitinophagaceae bacterium]|nr:hypothetical protein [Chitinophagaceae bacterium]
MKRKSILFFAIMIAFAFTAQAQGGGFQRRTVEERVKIAHDKIDSAFKLEAAKLTKVDEAFTTYYKDQDKAMQEMMSGGERPNREAMQEKLKPITEARDAALKAVLNDDQYKKWKEEIEPSLMPRRGGGGPRNQ